ncbi:MAG: ABC transporter ATP-binding protein [Clostridiaceae bacterium]|nr:ABC transporter ATP-binding protein [Clostridiaceae bacterium]
MRKNPEERFLWRALAETVRRRPWHTVAMLAAVVAGTVLVAGPSRVLRRLVDGPLTGGPGSLWQMALLYLGAVLAIGLSDLVREYGAMVLGQRILLRIRSMMLERLPLLPMDHYLNTPAGETMARFSSDIDAVNSLFTAGLVGAAADLLKIGGLLLALFAISPVVGWIAAGAIPVVYVLSDFFRRRIYQRQKVVRQRVSDINTGIQEIYSGMNVIKVFGRERHFAERFEPLLEGHRVAMNANSVYDAWFPCVLQTVRAAVIALVLVAGAGQNATPLALGLSLGALAASADLMIRLFEPIEAAAGELLTIQQAMAGLVRIRAYFRLPTETEGKQPLQKTEAPDLSCPAPVEADSSVSVGPCARPDIVLTGVRFSYRNGADVLHGTDLTIPTGTKAALAGRTGSGKTTLLHLVVGLYPVAEGSIRVGGVNPYLLAPEERRRRIGIVPQTVVVFNGSIRDNITLRDDAITRDQVLGALELVGLREMVDGLEEGLDTLLGEGAAHLSFGQTQLLSLARALVTDPLLLLLDELTSGLDALTERKVLDAIRAVGGKKTILTVSHRLSGLLDVDTVHIMEKGRIVESGPPRALAREEGWYARYKRLEDLGWRIE